MRNIDTGTYPLEIGPLSESTFESLLKEKYSDCTILILVDENSQENCLYALINQFDILSNAEVMQLPSGEEHKQMEIVEQVWEALTEYRITRHDLIINLGGGMITDMGGFIASCYKRGIDFINIPTTLLGMVDASIGGKTGVNLGSFKNQIGLFSYPQALYVDPVFLDTLPDDELLSGLAEMLKHGIITDRTLFNRVAAVIKEEAEIDEELLKDSIEVKNSIVKEDPTEKGVRKKLNFGHTAGHVIEGHFINKERITHGHCVALGMVIEAFISVKKELLSQEEFEELSELILKYYELPKFSDDDILAMIGMLDNDKKNQGGKILCCLLKSIGECVIDVEVTEQEFLETFFHFRNLNLSLN